jgi:hypothetical protein
MEFFQDEKALKKLITRTFSRMNIIDPSIKPWKLGQKITAVNPHILHHDRYMQQNCMPAFWSLKFESDSDVGTSYEAYYRFFCRENDRFEDTRTGTHQLLMLLAFGFFSVSDWVEICYHGRSSRRHQRSSNPTATTVVERTVTVISQRRKLVVSTRQNCHVSAHLDSQPPT